MPLPDQLERLNAIPIDTLGLSDSTSALLKWYGLTTILDCIAFFYRTAQDTNAGTPWSLLFTLMFGEVKPALVRAGYWELALDAEVWRVFREQNEKTPRRMVICWQGQDVDLYEIPTDQLALPEGPPQVGTYFQSIGAWIDYFLQISYADSKYSFELHKPADLSEDRPLYFYEYMFELVQPRLVELGYWAFVEAHVDDFVEQDRGDERERDIEWNNDWERGGDIWETWGDEDFDVYDDRDDEAGQTDET